MELQQLNQRQFEQFRDFIYAKSGIRIDERKITLLSNRIRQRLKANDIADFDSYYRCLRSPLGTSELEHFLDAITTNETFFFRTQAHFDWLKSEFLSELLLAERSGRREKTIRIWSAGCATGAEPYTIAICLAEQAFRLREWELSILGTDISEKALGDAREGAYQERAVESVSEQQRRRFFEKPKDDQLWRVKHDITKMVSFETHNLLIPLGKPLFDCIFIRNVLIYFDRDSKQRVIKNLIRQLAEGGYLVVGPSEGIYDMLDPLEKRKTFLYQKSQ
ncbi:MAG: CheR family methyltransferase [Gemmataceae bacterium]